MEVEFDLIVRAGTVIDGRGGAPVEADIAIRDGQIAAIGAIHGRATEEIDAKGLIVTPGFVDIHTHYDGHATWTDRLRPSSSHGVTTAVMGNCGVGFAPCRPGDRERLIGLMEGVEDIPRPVLAAGLPWRWDSLPSYLDFLETRRFDMDIAAQLPHAPLRVYVMGARGVARGKSTEDDMSLMRRLTHEAMASGAIGFSSSRSLNHKSADGEPTPSLSATERELTAIALGLRDAGHGVLQFISDFDDPEGEFAMLRRLVEASGRPMSISLLQSSTAPPDRWRTVLSSIEQANRDGLRIRGQVCGRPIGALIGLELSFNPFSFCPSYSAVDMLPHGRKLSALREPALRKRLLDEFPGKSWQAMSRMVANLDKIFMLNDPPDYEPKPDRSIAAEARKRVMAPKELAYELMVQGDGRAIFYIPAANYVNGDSAVMSEMLRHPDTILGLGDGGAHCGTICDASMTTYMLTRWAARNGRSDALPLPLVVKALSAETASAVGLTDRGVLAPGYKADINVIDPDRLRLLRPHMVYDLPEGGGRLDQRSEGYVATIVSGSVTYAAGEATGRLPGRLARGPRNPPAGSFVD